MANLIYKKMSEVMAEIKYVSKDKVNNAQGFKFRGIDDMINALYPALTKHGVFMTPRTTSYSQEIREVTRSNGKPGVDKHVSLMVEYDFYAEDGSKITVGPIAAEGLDSGDKATNKALSAALKYALIQTFSVPTEDMAEADLDTPTISLPQSKQEGKVSELRASGISGPTTPDNSIKASEVLPAGAVQSSPAKKSSFRNKPNGATTPVKTNNEDMSW